MSARKKLAPESAEGPRPASAPKDRARRPRLAKADPVLNRASLAELRRIAGGEMLTAVRTFPFGWHFRLAPTDARYDTEAKGIIPAHATVLIAEGLVTARQVSSQDDFLVFDLTPKGAQVARDGLPKDDDSQFDFLGGAA